MKRLLMILQVLILTTVSGFSMLAHADAQAEIDGAMSDSNTVDVFKKKNWLGMVLFYGFEPENPISSKGLIIYPGAFVSASAYAPLARHFADLGYRAAIINPPFQFGFLGVQYATYVKRYWGNSVDNYVIAGHSLGGTVAAMYANSNDKPKDKVGALVLLASYPTPIIDNLSNDPYKVVSIWASEDGLTSESDITRSASLLPPDAEFIKIEGGNHTQFYYSDTLQKNDNPATIGRDEQQGFVEQEIWNLLQII